MRGGGSPSARIREWTGPPTPLDATLVLMDDFMQSGRTTDGLVLLHRCADRVTADSSRLLEVATREAWFAPDQEYRSLTRRILDQVSRPAGCHRNGAGRSGSVPASSGRSGHRRNGLLLARRVWAAGTNGAPAPTHGSSSAWLKCVTGIRPLPNLCSGRSCPRAVRRRSGERVRPLSCHDAGGAGTSRGGTPGFEAAAEAMSPLPADPTKSLDGSIGRSNCFRGWRTRKRAALGASGVAR